MSTLTKEGSDKLKAVWDNFMATMMKALAGWNTGCVLELSLFDVLDISKFSFFPNEQEGILVPNTQLVVLGKADARLIIHDTQKRLVKCIYLQQGGQGIQLIS